MLEKDSSYPHSFTRRLYDFWVIRVMVTARSFQLLMGDNNYIYMDEEVKPTGDTPEEVPAVETEDEEVSTPDEETTEEPAA